MLTFQIVYKKQQKPGFIRYKIEYLTYQWYRLNPATYEMTEIPGATDLKYYYTGEDLGYGLFVRAHGDDKFVGGYSQQFMLSGPVIYNRAYLTDITTDGFKLHLYRSVPQGLTTDDLSLYYDDQQNYIDLDIISVENVRDNAVFAIKANIPSGTKFIDLFSRTKYWVISGDGGCHFHEGISIELPPDFGN